MLAKQILIISLIFPFIEYYSFVAVKRVARNLKKQYKIVVITFYIVLSIAVISALFLFRKWAAVEWPSVLMKTLVNLLIGVFFGKFIIAVIMFAGDILVLIKAFARLLFSIPERLKGKPVQGIGISRSQFISVAAVAAGAAFTGGLGYGMTNRYRYKLRYVPLQINGLPNELRNLRIAQISDIHAGSFDNPHAVKKGIDLALQTKPDIILFTGDLVNYRSEEFDPYFEIFKKLEATLGIYAVLGNHDYSDYLDWPSEEAKSKDFEKLKKHFDNLGWKLLLNENLILKHNSVDFALIGSENWSTRLRFTKYGDLRKAMNGIESSAIPLKILMTHDPSHWDAQIRPEYPDINLTLSGHTHGMQLGVEIPGLKWSPAQYLYKQWAGLYRENDQYLYVNRGFGFIGYNGRLGILPEVTLLELV
jgi:hypothetical protein